METGEILEGKYRIVDILGQGGMGKVYLAENIKLGTLRTIKEISRSFGDGCVITTPTTEQEILKKLQHPALPAVVDIFEDADNFYMVVEYIAGASLDRKLSEEGPFAQSLVIDWAQQLCDVLGYLHSRMPHPIIYRDMKPSNIILTDSGMIKLIDFGIAREYKEVSSADTMYIGTRGYAAPEQYGSGQTTQASDVYSLGITIYSLLTGCKPEDNSFEIKPLSYFGAGFSDELEAVLTKCTKRNPADRYRTAEELKEALAGISSGSGEEQGSKSFKSRAPSGPRTKSQSSNGSEKNHLGGSEKIFRKLVLTVWDNAEFGCELAYMAARMSGYTVLLADLDLLAPKADLFLKLRKHTPRIISEGIAGKTGLNIIIDSHDKDYFHPGQFHEAAV
ncbi:MAG: serine/threonine protein kinase, partial [Clostridiales bacterium]|nr:serine/threonine protein kinase [Clostridiales bacterium]